ncbi:cbb3-type cytochrome oxidase assembly protein CcoS [Leucothrix pacifica]|uniref:Cbb3-type cytochrome oxidase assembly protein CcoS n=1 Tax=Leucothrix pacifica TaxID=1247513 RepID=A0A317CDF9_9GAMM|nr:cbb3-type cytochrome oxidase assembly protein CcoS [Leucothrix pacifica]PWQ96568.1 cbb3-type cytochrome oxidase assembly protein CcoS [Leucothrix pacifica]
MNIIYLLIPLSLVLVVFAIGAFFWAVRSGQFDDLHTPALKVLDDDKIQNESDKQTIPTK